MGKYLKMADVFKGELFIDSDCDDVIVDDLSLTVLESFSGSDVAKFALHAINSHDELVAEVERLQAEIKEAFIDGCQAGWDMSGEGYNAEYCSTSDGKIREKFIAKADEYTK